MGNVYDQAPGARAAVLLRISHDPSGDARSTDSQRSAALRRCRANGWLMDPEADEYLDTASASEFGAARGVVRKSYERLKREIATGRYGVLVVAEVSRSARDVGVLEDLRKLLVRQGMLWCIGDRVMDPAEPGDTTLILIEGVLAQTETHRMSKRLRRGVVEARAAGRAPAGPCPFGYVRPPRETGQRVVQVPHPINGPLVAWAVREAVPDGVSLSAIGQRWTKEGQPAQDWGRTSVRRAIQNPVVIGLTVHKGELVKGNWQPLVTADEYALAKEILSSPKRRKNKSLVSTTLLSSVAQCHLCGGRIGAKYTGYKEPHYRCLSGAGSWPVAPTDAEVTVKLFEEVHFAAARAEARLAATGGEPVDPQADALDALAKAEAEYKELNDHWHDLGLNLAEFAAAVKPLRKKVTEARERAKTAEPAPEPMVLDPKLYPALWARMTLDEQRQQVRHWVTVTLGPDGVAVTSNGR